jgi:hypothetical protein
MTERFQRISVTELDTVRITCLHCKITTELSIDSIHKAAENGDCVHCKSPLFEKGVGVGSLQQLKNAIRSIKEASDRVRVEFSIREPD